ncbi:MAG: hypothetical protein M3Y50_17385, partial [Acidobacteriota bacterium]|nr:hypothetical protein [Acidobacteriota bacterium]
MKISGCLVVGCMVAASVARAAQNKAAESEPVAWGAISGNSSCVIFAEGHKTSGRFYGVAITTKTVGKLTLVEAQNYS